MKLKIPRKILMDALHLVANISPRATSEPIISNVLLEAKKDRLTFRATNYDISFFGKYEAEVIQEGKICLSTNRLFLLAREFSDDIVEIETTPQNWVYLYCGTSKVKLPGVEPGLFPKIEFKTLPNIVSIEARVFHEAIDKITPVICENESRKNLTGLNFKIELLESTDEPLDTVKEFMVSFVGADGFRGARYTTKIRSTESLSGDVIIPKKSLPVIRKILESCAGKATISFDENTLQINGEDIWFKTRLVEAEYPNLQRLLEFKGQHEVRISRHALTNAARILFRVSNDDPNAVVKLTLENHQAYFETQSTEFGEGDDQIDCDYEDEHITIGLNIKYLLEALQGFEGSSDDLIKVTFQHNELPLVFQVDDWDFYRVVQMPVRMKW